MADLRIYLLGTPHVEIDRKRVDLGRQKALGLLAYVAMRVRDTSRPELAALLWPEAAPEQARANLRHTLSVIRKELGDAALRISRESVALGDGVWVDALHFRDLLSKKASQQSVPEEPAIEIVRLSRAAELYGGSFLAGLRVTDSLEFDDWSLLTSENLRRDFIHLLERLSQLYEREGEYELSISTLRQVVQTEPERESAHRRLMVLYATTGDRQAALRQYRTCALILAGDGEQPVSKETRELYMRLKARRSILPSGAPAEGSLEREAETREQVKKTAVGAQRKRAGTVATTTLGVLLLLVVAFLAVLREGGDAPPRVAVLQLRNLGEESGREWVAEGMRELLIGELSKISAVRVASRMSLLPYDEGEVSVRKVAVDYLVKGSVLAVEDEIRVSLQLIDARADICIWADTYRATTEEVIDLNIRIVRRLAREIAVNLSANDKS